MTTSLPEKMRASVLTKVGVVELEDRPLPTVAADEVLIEVAAVGVCGSDVHWYREFHIGDLWVEDPMILGHEASGRIVAVGAAVNPARVGERVAIEPQHPCGHCEFCVRGEYNLCPEIKFYATPPIDGAFCQYVTIQQQFAFPLPDAVSFEAAALLEPLSVAVATARKAKISAGHSVLIAGAGPIGLIMAQTARAFGATEVVVSDPMPARRERALRYGATRVVDPKVDALDTPHFDSFIDASGAEVAMIAGINAVKNGGTAVLVGMGPSVLALPMAAVQWREVVITAVFRYNNTWPTALELVKSGLVDLDSLVTDRYGLDDVKAALEGDTRPESLKSIVYPNGIPQ